MRSNEKPDREGRVFKPKVCWNLYLSIAFTQYTAADAEKPSKLNIGGRIFRLQHRVKQKSRFATQERCIFLQACG